MQGSKTEKDNVVSLFAQRDAVQAQAGQTESLKDEEEEELLTIMEKNAKNAERLRKERNQANKSVLRSYRIKH